MKVGYYCLLKTIKNDPEENMGKINYEIELEVFEGTGCKIHKIGERFKYPEDIGRICPWLLDSLNSMIRVLQFEGHLPWKYTGTNYEKELDNELTTEFVRCPDPTKGGIVMKIVRKKIEPKEVGWC
jgi:uncharacterized repeat protein (TIGR04076 family)